MCSLAKLVTFNSVRTEVVLAWSFMFHSRKFDMQHDYFQVFGQTICYHVVTFVSLLNLIYNMTLFLKKLNFDLLTPSPDNGWGRCLSAQKMLP